jgi:hypothetical protein
MRHIARRMIQSKEMVELSSEDEARSRDVPADF